MVKVEKVTKFTFGYTVNGQFVDKADCTPSQIAEYDRLAAMQKPKRKRRRSSRSGPYVRKNRNYAASVIYRAMAELLERVNDDDEE